MSRKPKAHFLHIRKCGGTAIKGALSPLATAGTYRLQLHPHERKLRDIPPGEPLFFCVRDPIARYVSGFYSRQRQGKPRYFSPWSDAERQVFVRFNTADCLAVALSADEPPTREAAETAMRSIRHVRDFYSSWFASEDELVRRWPDVLMILFQETLDADFVTLVQLLGLESRHPALPTDDIAAHRSPTSVDQSLSPLALENLNRWYASDFSFVALCRELMSSRAGDSPIRRQA